MGAPSLTKRQRDEDDRFASFDDFDGEDVDHLAHACAEHDVDLSVLRTLFDHPLAIAAVLRAVREQRPLARLAAFATGKSSYKMVIDTLLQEGRFRRCLYEDHPDESPARMERIRSLSTQLYTLEKRLSKTDLERRDPHPDELPLALLSLGTVRDTIDAYDAALRQRFSLLPTPRISTEKREETKYLLARVTPPVFAPWCRRLVRIGLLEVDVVHPDYATFKERLPDGATFVTYEIFAALQRYPRLLDWMRLHPAGGIKEGVTSFGLWLLDMNTGTEYEDRALRLGITFDELDRSIIGSLQLARYHDHLSAVDFVPYLIPVSETKIDTDL